MRCAGASRNGCVGESFDIVAAFLDVLGNAVRGAPENFERGALLVDTAMDLETNYNQRLPESPVSQEDR